MNRRSLLGALALPFLAGPTRAQPALTTPQGPVILRLEGRISRKNTADTAAFDLQMLDGLPQGAFSGETPWTRGHQDFSGPLLSALLDAVGAQGERLKVIALNEYDATIPMTDPRQHAIILATRRNGEPMLVRDKGPVWVIYPMDKVSSLRNEITYSRSVWQVARIVVV